MEYFIAYAWTDRGSSGYGNVWMTLNQPMNTRAAIEAVAAEIRTFPRFSVGCVVLIINYQLMDQS